LNEKKKDVIVRHLGFDKESYQGQNHTSVNLKKELTKKFWMDQDWGFVKVVFES
jgi:hypothetical protein